MQAPLALIGSLSALISWWFDRGLAWLIGGLLLLVIIPFTLVVILPTNKRLEALLIEEAEKKCFLIQAYCFMPDHLHLLVSGRRPSSDCLAFINAFKQRSAFAFKQATGQRLWQHKPYDHILRADDRWESVGYYIWMNPVRKGLCARPEDWSHSGSQTVDWRRLLSPPEIVWVPPWKSSAGL